MDCVTYITATNEEFYFFRPEQVSQRALIRNHLEATSEGTELFLYRLIQQEISI